MTTADSPDWAAAYVMKAQAALGAALRGDVNAARSAVQNLPDTVRADVATAAGILATICTDAPGDP